MTNSRKNGNGRTRGYLVEGALGALDQAYACRVPSLALIPWLGDAFVGTYEVRERTGGVLGCVGEGMCVCVCVCVCV